MIKLKIGDYVKLSKDSSFCEFGFNIFYMGINLGSFGALFVASWLKDKYGFSAPFYSSIVVSVVMLVICRLSKVCSTW